MLREGAGTSWAVYARPGASLASSIEGRAGAENNGLSIFPGFCHNPLTTIDGLLQSGHEHQQHPKVRGVHPSQHR